MSMTEAEQIKVLEQIIEMRDVPNRCMILFSSFEKGTEIKKGQFIFTLSPHTNVMKNVGYAVQVRKKAGDFGSDLILIRLANGGLQTWSNQSFFNMTEEQEALARKIFVDLPEDEDQFANIGYKTFEGERKTGFLIEDESYAEPATAESNVNIKISDGESSTHISFF